MRADLAHLEAALGVTRYPTLDDYTRALVELRAEAVQGDYMRAALDYQRQMAQSQRYANALYGNPGQAGPIYPVLEQLMNRRA